MTKLPLTVHTVPGTGAEDVVVDPDGYVITGTEDGAIFRVHPDGRRIDRIGHTGGRPLGIELLPDGRVLVADAHRGLLALDPVEGAKGGGIEPLVTTIDGRAMKFCNNAAVAGNGDIWFSDSSLKYSIEQWKDDFVQNTRTGRLFCRRASGAVEQVLDGLAFANGVALAADESFVAVAETGARTVVRHWLTPSKTAGGAVGQRDYLVTDLPGYPDNIARGSDGLIWVTIASPKDPLVERLQHAPLGLRRAVTKLPDSVQPKPKRTARVMAFDDAGSLVHDLDCDATGFHMVTGVREYDGQVWLGSLIEPAVAVVAVP